MSSETDYQIQNIDEIATPALVLYPHIVQTNIRSIGNLLGGYDDLRPHIKTHKMSRVVRMEMDAGITKFKCATPKEAALLAAIGVKDIIIAYQMVGPQIDRTVELQQTHPKVDLKVIADDPGPVRDLAGACVAAKIEIGVMIDLNTGMNRTGVRPGSDSVDLAQCILGLEGVRFAGIHVYDGHVGGDGEKARIRSAEESIQRAVETRKQIEAADIPVPLMVASGTQGFDVTSKTDGVDEVSPGTWIFWDTGYGENLEFDFKWAALVVSRVISTPGPDLITLDAGSKALAPDTPTPHFKILNLDGDPEFVRRNEEHQLLKLPASTPRPDVGDVLYLVPRHVCTTVNLWDEACVIDESGTYIENWPIDARGH